MGKVVIFAVALAVVFISILVLVIVVVGSRRRRQAQGEVPKKVWCYWQGEMPEIVVVCIDRCRRLNPEYELTVLNDDNVSQHVPELDPALLEKPIFNDSPARRSDLVRCHAVAHHGGIWMDASIICMKPFDEWLDRSKEFVGYHIGQPEYHIGQQASSHPVIESWFFAAKPGCTLMREWCREFSRMGEFGTVEEYLDDLRAADVDISKVSMQEYLAVHCAAQKVIQKHVTLSPDAHELFPAEAGPFLLLTQTDWDSAKAMRLLVDEWETFEDTVNLVKLRGADRGVDAALTKDLVDRLALSTARRCSPA